MLNAILLSALMSLNTATAEPPKEDNPNADSHVVFYVPHQDDEVLTMGSGIISHLSSGHNVHVVLLTDGGASRVREQLGMERSAFVAARNRELSYALDILGVKRENVYSANIRDGELTIDATKEVIRHFESMYPNAKHKTYTYTDGHPDHANAGEALRQLTEAGEVTDARYYIRRGEWPEGVGVLMRTLLSDSDAKILRSTAQAYSLVSERRGFYGIGYRSVPKSFDAFLEIPINYYHR